MAIKYMTLVTELRTDIRMGVYRQTGRLPTEMQLAQMYHVSRQTVRRALSILSEEGLIERRQGSGSRVVDSPALWAGNNVAVVASFVDDYIFPSLLHYVQGVLEQHNFSTLVYSTQNQLNREREILQQLIENPVRGLLVEGVKTALPNPNLDLYHQIQQMGIPIVFFHSGYPELNTVCISDDNEGGGYLAAEYLMERGHSRIAGIFKNDDLQGLQRYHGFFSALRDRGLPYPEQDIFWFSSEQREQMMEKGKSNCLRSFARTVCKQCSAVICHNDEVAHSLIQVLQDEGIKVPKGVAVLSFDNTYYSDIGPVPITSLSHQPGGVGELAAKSLVELIMGREASSQTVAWTLVEKKST